VWSARCLLWQGILSGKQRAGRSYDTEPEHGLLRTLRSWEPCALRTRALLSCTHAWLICVEPRAQALLLTRSLRVDALSVRTQLGQRRAGVAAR
jgi:hypothetical protein